MNTLLDHIVPIFISTVAAVIANDIRLTLRDLSRTLHEIDHRLTVLESRAELHK